MTSIHNCAVPGCGKWIKSALLMCSAHWRCVPSAIQTEVYGAYDRYVRGELSLTDLREVQSRATASVVAKTGAKGGV